jgi:competence protein ComEC
VLGPAWLRDQFAAQAGRWRLWSPVAFGSGAAAYFALDAEPSRLACAILVALAVAAALAAVRLAPWRWLAALVVLAAMAAGGVGAAKLRTEAMRAPPVPAGLGAARVEGYVIDVASPGTSGPRLLIAPVRIARVDPDRLPRRIRVTVPKDAILGPGTGVRMTALLNPPPSKAAPGAYDFARDGYFQGVGGSGLALKPPTVVDLPDQPWRLSLLMQVNAWRWSLSRRIAEAAGPEAAGLAVAMTTGHEAWLSEAQETALRDAGLAHIISISGLHMAIVGGAVFFAVRLLISAWPWAALRVSGKKVAAGAGLGAVILYALVSGWPPAAERAALTAGIAFIAILLDRRAVSFETLAVAALAVTAVQPEAVMQPGFQMSFAATTALIALAEAWPRRPRPFALPWAIRLAQTGMGWFSAAVAASFVAGLATQPFAIQHFNRITLYGLLANLATEPLSTFVIMPGLALGAVLAPFGLAEPFLAVAGWGLAAMTQIARMFAAWPNAVMVAASAPGVALAVSFGGLLFACLWRGPLRWLGLPLFAAVMIWPRPAPPALWIAPGGANVAVVADAQATPVRDRSQRFAFELWARRRGLTEPADAKARAGALYNCDRSSCSPTLGTGPRVALWWGRRAPGAERAAALCSNADVVVLRSGEAPSGPACAGRLVIGERDFAWGRAAEVFRTADGWRVGWAEPLSGRRPWSHRLSEPQLQ